MFLVHSCLELIRPETTAISTPLDSVPLYIVHASTLVTILLKSSQAVSSSALFNLGTPTFYNRGKKYIVVNTIMIKIIH